MKELVSKADQPTTIDVARRTKDKQESLDLEFKVYHFAVIYVIDEKDGTTLGKEQDILDKHEDEVSSLTVRLQNSRKLTR